MLKLWYGGLSVLSVLVLVWLSIPWLSGRSVAGGLTAQGLAECPGTPNCVTTQSRRSDQRMEPIDVAGPADQVLRRVERVLAEMRGSHVVTSEAPYLHATFQSRWMRFVDDVEFWVDESAGQLHFRSASRLGYSDLGGNRKRMQEFAQRWRTELGGG